MQHADQSLALQKRQSHFLLPVDTNSYILSADANILKVSKIHLIYK